MLDTIPQRPTTRPGNLILVGIVIYALIAYMYATLRFSGGWSENDTTQLTRAIYYANESGSVIDAELTYGNGMTFQAVSLFLMNITGIPLETLQIYVYPALTSLLPLVAYVAYRTLTRYRLAALLATLILYLQPDFLFVTWRGSHEKITWILALLMFFFLGKSFSADAKNGLLRFILLFYLTAFAFVCSNAFFASSLITTIGLSFIGGWIILAVRDRIHHTGDHEIRAHIMRLFYVTLVCGIMLYLFFYYIYPPTLSLLNALQSLVDALEVLLLHGASPSNPYNYLLITWIDLRLFTLLTALSLLIFSGSSLVWLSGIPRFVRRKKLEIWHLPRLFLWLIYPTFALQLVVSLLVDRTAVLGSNLQVRLSTPAMLTAIPLVAIGIHALLTRTKYPRLRRLVVGIGALAIPCFAVLAMFKATNEPLFSFNWIFSTPNEQLAGVWVRDHHPFPALWTGIDNRVRTAMLFHEPDLPSQMRLYVGVQAPPGTQFYLVSALEELRWSRQSVSLFYLDEENRVYDNGLVQVFYRRPRTVFQR